MASPYCSNCRESIPADSLKRIAIGTGRSVVFCGSCNCYVAIEDKTPATPVKKDATPATDQPN